MIGADNQQERPNNSWVCGFVDGEGCFHVAINKMPKMRLGWQVLPEFRVVQHRCDIRVLRLLREVFGCGSIVKNHGDRLELRVRGHNNLCKIVLFFTQNRLHSKKRYDFELFAQVIALMSQGSHLTQDGLERIAQLASRMNRQKTRCLESPETIRRTHNKSIVV